MGHPTCIIEGLACWLTLCILEKIICNSTKSVQISFIETLKLIVFSWTIWWCYWQNVLMINEKNIFLTVSWLSGLLSAEIFISTGEWGVQMPPLTSENSYFLRSGPQGATLVMLQNKLIRSETCRTEAQFCQNLYIFIYDKEGKLAGPTQILPVNVRGPALILKTVFVKKIPGWLWYSKVSLGASHHLADLHLDLLRDSDTSLDLRQGLLVNKPSVLTQVMT